MKINVALFITALSTTAASAAAGEDGAAAAVDRPHLRALLQTNKLMACPGFLDSRDSEIVSSIASVPCDDTPNYCDPCGNNPSTNQFSNCYQDTIYDHDVAYFVKGCCTNSNNMNNCFGQNEEEDFIKANDVEKEEEQDTTTDKLGAPSSTLRASSLLRDNVFAKEGAEDFLEVAGCPAAVSNAPSNPCTADPNEGYSLDCRGCSGKTNCVSSNSCSSDFCTGNTWSAKCCNKGGQCNDASTQADASLLKVE
jgi:hypothetical protein